MAEEKAIASFAASALNQKHSPTIVDGMPTSECLHVRARTHAQKDGRVENTMPRRLIGRAREAEKLEKQTDDQR